MSFDPTQLPKGFPPDGLINQHGKAYITHVGLVWLANHRGKPWNGTIVDHEIKWNQNGEPIAAKVVYRVWDDEQEHTDIGDATLRNVGKMIIPHLIRMASTRAQNRALRAFVGYAGCTADELEIGDSYASNSEPIEAPSQAAPSQPAPRQEPRMSVVPSGGEPQCPKCSSGVYDNRATAQGNSPQFRCKNGKQCPGGKGDFGWASWEPDFFEVRNHSAITNTDRDDSGRQDLDERGESFNEEPMPF